MWVLQDGSFYFSSSLLFFVVSMYVCDCLFVLLSVTRRQLDRESWYTVKDSLTCQTWFSRPGSCLLCFFLLFFTAFTLGFLVFLTSLGLLVFLTSAVTFKKPFCMKKTITFASGLLVFLTFAVTFKKPFCIEKTF